MYTHLEWMHHLWRFFLNVKVRLETQGCGVGRLLWVRLEREVRAMNAEKLFALVREGEARKLRFLQERGFKVEQPSSKCCSTWCRPSSAAWKRRSSGCRRRATPSALLPSSVTPTRNANYEAASGDAPRSHEEAFVLPTLEAHWQRIISNPDHDPPLWFVVLKGTELVGLS